MKHCLLGLKKEESLFSTCYAGVKHPLSFFACGGRSLRILLLLFLLLLRWRVQLCPLLLLLVRSAPAAVVLAAQVQEADGPRGICCCCCCCGKKNRQDRSGEPRGPYRGVSGYSRHKRRPRSWHTSPNVRGLASSASAERHLGPSGVLHLAPRPTRSTAPRTSCAKGGHTHSQLVD